MSDNKVKVDNRILRCLFDVTGDMNRKLNYVFIDLKSGSRPAYFATNGIILLKVVEKEPELYMGEDCRIAIPVALKSTIKHKKDPNKDLYSSVVTLDEYRKNNLADGLGEKVTLETYIGTPIKIEFENYKREEELDYEAVLKTNAEAAEEVTLNLAILSMASGAISKLGVGANPTLSFQNTTGAITGYIDAQDFLVQMAVMPLNKTEARNA